MATALELSDPLFVNVHQLLYREHEHLSFGHTSIIEISVTSPRPELASMIANTLIDRYIDHFIPGEL